MELHALILSLLLLTIVSDTNARSVDTSLQCATTCVEPEFYGYEEGYTYQFQYSATVGNSIRTGSPLGDTIDISSTVQIQAITGCELVLDLSRTSLNDHNLDTTEWTTNLERNPLHFSFQAGRIDIICTSNDDPEWVLNIKRGILSTLQVTTNEDLPVVTETDVSGKCEYSYTASGDQITKTKDFNKCEDREKHLLFSHFTPYSNESPRQSFVHSEQSCTITMSGNELRQTVCTEEHVFRPFSDEESGAKTIISQTMTFQFKNRMSSLPTLTSTNSGRSNLVFVNEEQMALSTDISGLQNLFADVCTLMDQENYKQVSEDFIKMVFMLRRLDTSAIEQVHSTLDGACPKWESATKEMFLDALQWCGSESCVVFSTQLIAMDAEELSDEVAAKWISGMSLITKPTLPMLEGLKNIIESGRFQEIEKTYLTAGTMVNRICSNSVSNCMSEPLIRQTLAIFENKLGFNCRTTNIDRKQEILLALRAIGNAGRVSELSTIEQCALEVDNDMETRIAAVKSFRRMPCINTDRSVLSAITFNTEYDAEIRIEAYQAVMKCPSPQFIKQITALLDNEPVLQVASYVWTHLNQLLESTDPLKAFIKPLLLETEFAKPYELDPRKYSRFYEASLFSEQLNAGATVESSLVWSPKSFVPRSGTLDLTIDVFGQAVNLFEVGARVEGVEQLLQEFLGPKGYLKKNGFSDLFMTSDDEEVSEEDDEVDVTRLTRSADNSHLVELRNQYKSGMEPKAKPAASWFMRMFGNEMFYGNTMGMKPLLAEDNAINVVPLLTKLAQGGEYHYHDDTMLMNSAHVLPTGVGLPLTIAFNGSASIDLTATGKLDMTGLFTPEKNLDLNAHINPRAVVLIVGAMSVDAHVTKVGIATESSALTSWKLGGTASIVNGRSVRVSVESPYDRNTVITVNHKLMTMSGDEMQVVAENEVPESLQGCTEEVIGQQLCLNSNFDEITIFPVSGPISASIYFLKPDSGFTSYVLEGQYDTTYDGVSAIPQTFTSTISIDTPGSKVQRHNQLQVSYSQVDKTFDVTYRQAENVYSVQGALEETKNRKNVVISYNNNGDLSRFETTVEKENNGAENQLSITSSLRTPTKTISGVFVGHLTPSQQASMELTITNLLESPISISMSLEDQSDASRNHLRYTGEGQISIPSFVSNEFRFDMNVKPKTDVFILGLTYQFSGLEEQSIHFSHKRKDRSTATVTDWEASQKLSMSQYTAINHHVELAYKNGESETTSFAKFGYGRHAGHKDNTKYVSCNQTFHYTTTADSLQLDGFVGVEMPSYDIDYKGAVSHSQDPSSMTTSVNLGSYGVMFSLQDNTPVNGLINKELSLEVPTPWGIMNIRDSIEETSSDVYHLVGQFQLGNSRGLSVNSVADIENLSGHKSLNVKVTGDNSQSLLSASSVLDMQQKGGFSFQNQIESKYNEMIRFNLEHAGGNDGGFLTTGLLEHVPDKHVAFKVDFKNLPMTSSRLIRGEFKDSGGVIRFIQLEGSKQSQQTQSRDTKNIITAAFTTSVRAIPVKSVIIEGDSTITISSTKLSAHVTADNNELLGTSFTYSYDVQSDNSANTAFNGEIRQGLFLSSAWPNQFGVSGSAHNTLSDGHQISLTFTKDQVEILDMNFTVAGDSSSITGTGTQRLSETAPENFEFTISRSDHHVRIETTFDRENLNVQFVKASNSITGTLQHSSRQLRTLGVPRSIESTVLMGTKLGDSGEGFWLDSVIDNSPLNAKMTYEYNNEHILTATLSHSVNSIEMVPQVAATITASEFSTTGQIDTSLVVDGINTNSIHLEWTPSHAGLTWNHKCQYMDSLSIPRSIEVEVAGQTKPTIRASGSLTVDDKSSALDILIDYSEYTMTLDHICTFQNPPKNDHLELGLLPDKSGVKLLLRQSGVTKNAQVSYGFENTKSTFNLMGSFEQSFYLNENYPLLPTATTFNIGYKNKEKMMRKEFSFEGRFNDYQIDTSSKFAIRNDPTVLVVDTSLEQNIYKPVSELRTHSELEIRPYMSVSLSTQYTLKSQPQVSLFTSLGYEKTGNMDVVSFALRQNQPELLELQVPDDFKAVASLTIAENEIECSLVGTVDQTIQKMSIGLSFDKAESTVRVSMSHDINCLHEAGVYSNVVAHFHALPTAQGDAKGLEFTSSLQLDDNTYRVGGSGDYLINSDTSSIVFNINLNQNIAELDAFRIPRAIASQTTIEYGLLDLSGQSSIQSILTRTMHNPETGEDTEIVNHINLGVNLQLFNWNAEISGSHDFDVEDIPRSITYQFIASGSSEMSKIFYKSVMMSVTIDGKKQVATISVNRNPADKSFFLATTHNVTQIFKYGVPGNMSINFRRRSAYDADLSIVYDTAMKSVGIKFDYLGEKNKVILYFHHNFDILVDMLNWPKNIGIETWSVISQRDAEFDLKTVWGSLTNTANLFTRWDLQSGFLVPTITYKLKQNYTTNDVFPQNTRFALQSTYGNGFSVRCSSERKYVSVTGNWYLTDNFDGTLNFEQNIYTEDYPRMSSLEVLASTVGKLGGQIDATLRFERAEKLHTVITGSIYEEQKSGSLRVETTQNFVGNDIIPTHTNLLVDGNVDMGFDTSISLTSNQLSLFSASLDTGFDAETQTVHAQLDHTQQDWIDAGVPAHVRAEVQYTMEDNLYSVATTLTRGRTVNHANLATGLIKSDDAVSLSASYSQDFDEIPDIARTGSASVFLQKSDTSISALANGTYGDFVFFHSITAVYNSESTEFDMRFDATQDNQYLNELDVPHQVVVAVSADWSDGISGSIRTDYGDKFTLLRIKKDNNGEDSYLKISHNWPMQPKVINIDFSGALRNHQAKLAITVDGVSKDIVLSSNREGNFGEINFSHGFEGTSIPQEIQLSGTYRTSPDMHVLINAEVDGQHNSIEAGLSKLDDGFHITTTLTDGVTRSATFRKTFSNGGFSLGLEHSIPELQKFIPGSIEASGSISSSPIPTITASFRNQQNTQTLSAEADIDQLAFTFTHSFENLPLPKSVQLSFSGSRTPMQGSVILQIDQVTRSLSATFDPELLFATLSSDVPELPLPGFIRIEASGAVSPPSCRLSVTVNGEVRTISIETSFVMNEKVEVRFQQNVPELSGLFVPKDIVVRVACNEEQTGGELYISVDGLERRAGGNVNLRKGVATFFQSAPEFNYLPRNVTLAIEGSMEPISGSITLTIDEVERKIQSQVDQRSLFAALTHTVPEIEPYIPRHLSVSGTFRKESSTSITSFTGVTVSYTKENVKKHVSINLDLTPNSVHLTVAQTAANKKTFPSHIEILLSGDIESKNASLQVSVDSINVRLGGEVYIGDNDGWYGATATVQQNIVEMLTNCEIMLKGRESDSSYEINSIINLSGMVDYSAAASLTPSTTSKRKALIWSYNHHLDGEDREISGVLKVMSRSGVNTFIYDFNQSSPTKMRTRVEIGSEIESLTSATFTLDTQQNIEFLLNNEIPRTIENGRLQFNADAEHFNIQASGLVNRKSVEKELNVEWNFDNEIYTITGEFTGDRAYSGAIHIPTSPTKGTVEVSYEVRNSKEAPAPEVTESISINYLFNINSPSITLNVNQAQLNGFGVPITSILSFSQSTSEYNLQRYAVRLTLDESSSELSLQYNLEDVLNLKILAAFTNNIEQLIDLSVPTLLQFSLDFNNVLPTESKPQVFAMTLGGNYNKNRLYYEIRESLGETNGKVSQTFSHNIPVVKEAIGFFDVVETYTYTYLDGELYLNGTVNRDNNVHIGDYQLSINRDGTFHYSNIYDSKGYISDFVIGNENHEFIFSFNLKNTEAHTIFAINVNAGDNFNYGSKITINDIDYALTTSLEDYSASGLTGKTLQIAYSVDKVPCSLTVTLAADESFTEGKLEINTVNKKVVSFLPRRCHVSATYDLTQFNIECSCGQKRYLMTGNYNIADETITMSFSNSYSNIEMLEMLSVPAEISATGSFSLDNSQATISADEIDLLRLSVTNGVISVVSRDLTNAVVLRVSGNYIYSAQKSINARIICRPLEIDVSTSQTFVMFERNTGNSSYKFSFTDNNSHNQFVLATYAYPTSTHAADFIVALDATSTYTVLPFVLKLKFDSDYNVEESIYDHEFTSTLNSQNLDVTGHYTPTMFTTTSTWTKSGTPSTLIVSGSEKIEPSTGRKNSIVKMQWGEPDDSLEVRTSSKSTGLSRYYSILFTQPSDMFSYTTCGMMFETDTTNDFKMDFNIHVDDETLGVNTTYVGVLPQVYGKHDLTVDIKQPITKIIPSEFRTKGVMTISSEGLYLSDWRITSENKELVVLKKDYMPRDGGYELDILWQQSIETSAFRYFKLTSSGSLSDTNVQGQGSIQVDNMPLLRGSINLGSVQNNQSMDLSLSTGPLAPWVNVRELKTTGWYKSTPNSRKIHPEFSITVDVDDKVYHVDTTMTYGANSRSAKYTHLINLIHPMNLVLMGMKVPKEHHLGFSSMNRASSCRIVLDYDNERIDHPFKLTQLMRWNNGDTDLEATTEIKFTGASNDDITMHLIKEDKLTIRLQYPEAGIDGDVVIGAVSNVNMLNFNVLAKSYASEAQKSWKFDITFNKVTNIIELNLNTPNMDEITLQGDLSEIISQASQLLKRLAADATNTELQFTYGINTISDGYDMYIGYYASDGLPYTLHMAVGMEESQAYATLQTKIDFELDVEIARADVDLVESRLIQLKLTASPAITKFFKGAISKTEMEFARKVTWFSTNLVQFLEALKSTVSGSENVQTTVSNILDSMIEKVQFVKDLSINFVASNSNSATSRIQIFESMIESHVRNALVYVLDSIDSLKNIILQPFTELRDEYYGPIIQKMRTQMALVLKPITDQLNKIQAGQLFMDILEEAIQKTVKYVATNGESALATARAPLSDLLVVTGNEIIFNIPLQFDVEHFTPLPTLGDVKTWLAQSALAIYVDDVVQTMYSYTKQYYRVRSLVYMPRDELLPPFKGHAFVSGFRHFSTFDNKYYDFQSSCATSHVLATDGRGGNFTVAITYADPSLSSSQDAIEVFIANKHVKINKDYSIESNERTKQLPLELNVMSVTLEGNVVHVRDMEDQLDVACDFTKDLCTFDVSPYFFSSTAGLAGIFNNEPSDDFTGPEHQRLSTPAEMAAAWDVSATSCSSSNAYTSCDSTADSPVCFALFEDTNSDFRSCFGIVDPAPFMKMCRDDMCNSDDSAMACAASAAYAYKCKLAGAPLMLPNQCIVCSDVSGHHIEAGRTRTAMTSSTDIVVVLEEGNCMRRSSMYKAMRKLIKRFDGTLSDNHIRHNRYTLVGYGGPGGSYLPHTVTIRGHSSTKRKGDFLKAFRKININSEASASDALDAISYASKLPFRMGSKPIILLLSCSECSDDSKVSYSSVEYDLMKQGIAFHHAPKTQISTGIKKTVYGYDSETAMLKSSDMSSAMVKQSKSDVCVPLATGTGGSVWDASLINESDFAGKLGTFMAQKSSTGVQQTCRCELNDLGIATSVCSTVP